MTKKTEWDDMPEETKFALLLAVQTFLRLLKNHPDLYEKYLRST